MKTDLAGLVQDGFAVLGVGLVSYGAWTVYPPAGFIVGGFMLFGLSVGAALVKSRRNGS